LYQISQLGRLLLSQKGSNLQEMTT